jgi:hypothetical protein
MNATIQALEDDDAVLKLVKVLVAFLSNGTLKLSSGAIDITGTFEGVHVFRIKYDVETQDTTLFIGVPDSDGADKLKGVLDKLCEGTDVTVQSLFTTIDSDSESMERSSEE